MKKNKNNMICISKINYYLISIIQALLICSGIFLILYGTNVCNLPFKLSLQLSLVSLPGIILLCGIINYSLRLIFYKNN